MATIEGTKMLQSDIVAMTPQECETALHLCWRGNKPAMFWGKPGGGKTSMIRAFCRRADIVARYHEMIEAYPWPADLLHVKARLLRRKSLPLIMVNLSMMEPVDTRGLPHDDGAATVWRRPAWLPTLEKDGPYGLIFFDEVNTNRAMFPTLFQIFGPTADGVRCVGEHEFPETWLPIAAGNYRSDKAAGVDMPSAFNNRVFHFDFTPSWQYFSGELADMIGLHKLLAGYIRFRPQHMHLMPGEESEETNIGRIPADARAFPTPRAWEDVSDILKLNPADDLRQTMISAKVGPLMAADFESYYQVASQFVPLDSILADPDKAPIPDSIGLMHAVTTGLAAHVTRATFGALVKYGKRLADKGYGDFYVTMGLDAARHIGDEVKQAPGYVQWQTDNAALMV
jgi:hypothetical protein